MTAVEIEYALVPQMAVFHERQGREDPLVGMFLHLKDQFGWAMFRKAFRTAIDDGITVGQRSVPIRPRCARLMLPHTCRSARPKTSAAFCGPLVPGYDARAVKDIVRARAKWSALPRESTRRKALRAAFLKGDYMDALK